MRLTLVYYAQNCAVSLSILALAFFGFLRVRDRRLISHDLFAWAFLPVFLNILLEPLLGWLSGRPGPVNGVLTRLAAVLLYALQPAPEALWIAYLYTSVRRVARLTGRGWLLLSLPLIVNLALALVSLDVPLTFSIGADNVYHRGPYYLLMGAMCYSYLIYYFCFAVAHHRQMLHHEFEVFLMGALPTALAGVLQLSLPGVVMIWQAASFTMLIFYLDILIHQANTDSLTGLANRRRFDGALNAAFSGDGAKAEMALILIDIDNFKAINDRYGHLMGDRALEEVGVALRRCARKRDVVARLGGDEFAMLSEIREPRDLERITWRVRESLGAINQRSGFPFSIETSVGSGCRRELANMTPEGFIQMIDNRMYDEKRVNHRRSPGEARVAGASY
jgi:diguanylate cyclase (GGDEF)-like protein